MGIVAGFLSQNVLKYLLNFGSVAYYLQYNSLKDFFPNEELRPNEDCTDENCIKRQKEFSAGAESRRPVKKEVKVKEEEFTNEWGIKVVESVEDTRVENVVKVEGSKSDLMAQMRSLNLKK